MSPEARQIATAKALGWTHIRRVADRNPDSDRMSYLAGSLRGIEYDEGEVPNYPGDLNAMHEAEKALRVAPYKNWCRYCEILEGICGGKNGAINATAAQRVEAFLRTLNLLEESTP